MADIYDRVAYVDIEIELLEHKPHVAQLVFFAALPLRAELWPEMGCVRYLMYSPRFPQRVARNITPLVMRAKFDGDIFAGFE